MNNIVNRAGGARAAAKPRRWSRDRSRRTVHRPVGAALPCAPVQLDTSGTSGALFGVVATVDGQGKQIVYFNDDNTNAVMRLTQ
jgi:hypothetical protein